MQSRVRNGFVTGFFIIVAFAFMTLSADFIGVIFAKSPRQISKECACAVVKVVREFGERQSVATVPAPEAKQGATAASAVQVFRFVHP